MYQWFLKLISGLVSEEKKEHRLFEVQIMQSLNFDFWKGFCLLMVDLDTEEFLGWSAFTFTKTFCWYSLKSTLHISMDFQVRFSLLIGYPHFTISCGQVWLVFLLTHLNATSQNVGSIDTLYFTKLGRKELIFHIEYFGNG